MYNRLIPRIEYFDNPHPHIALLTARDNLIMEGIRPAGSKWLPSINSEDDKCTLSDMNKSIRKYFNVKKRVIYNRKQRPIFRNFLSTISEKFGNKYLSYSAIVVLSDYCVFVDNYRNYYSFYEKMDDKVVSVWFLGNESFQRDSLYR